MTTHRPDVLTAKVREVRDDDWGLIFSSFRKGYSDSVRTTDREIPPKSKRQLFHHRICGLQKNASFKIACDPDDEHQILGWCCYQPQVLHYLYVREIYRGQGIGLQLLTPLAMFPKLFVTHWTADFQRFAAHNPSLYERVMW